MPGSGLDVSFTDIYSAPGTYNVTLTVITNFGDTAIVSKLITVSLAPVLDPTGDKVVDENKQLSFSVVGSDPDGDNLTYSATNLPSGATFNSATGVFSWTPSYSQTESYNVTFTVSDGNLTASETIKIMVKDVNTVAPKVSKIDPVNGATKVVAGKTIKVTFNEAIKKGSNFWVDLKNSSGKAVPFKYSISGKVLTIDPTKNLVESLYTLAIHTDAVTDLAGNPVAAKSTNLVWDCA